MCMGNFLYIGGSHVLGFTTRKLNTTDGSTVWSKDHVGAIVRAIAVDEENNVYTGGNSSVDNITTRKYDTKWQLELEIYIIY